MIQIDGPKRQICIKLMGNECVQALLWVTCGQAKYKHNNGEISIVCIDMADMDTKKIRIANLPLEVPDESLRSTLSPFGKIMTIQEEKWSRTYRYAVANGIPQVTMTLTQHIPSHLTIAGHRLLLSYEGQPLTCYGCGEIRHVYHACPKKQKGGKVTSKEQTSTYAYIAAHGTPPRWEPQENKAERVAHTEQVMIEIGEQDQENGQRPLNIATDPNSEQDRHMTPTGESNDDVTRQQQSREAITENANV
jgi:hypothetical protein